MKAHQESAAMLKTHLDSHGQALAKSKKELEEKLRKDKESLEAELKTRMKAIEKAERDKLEKEQE